MHAASFTFSKKAVDLKYCDLLSLEPSDFFKAVNSYFFLLALG